MVRGGVVGEGGGGKDGVGKDGVGKDGVGEGGGGGCDREVVRGATATEAPPR